MLEFITEEIKKGNLVVTGHTADRPCESPYQTHTITANFTGVNGRIAVMVKTASDEILREVDGILSRINRKNHGDAGEV